MCATNSSELLRDRLDLLAYLKKDVVQERTALWKYNGLVRILDYEKSRQPHLD